MKRKLFYLISISLVILVHACAAVTPNVKTEVLKGDGIMPGNYTLILYGARHGNDLETIAVLDYEGDDISIEPVSPEFDYKKREHVEDGQALTEAKKFVSWYHSFRRVRLSRIIDGQGRMLGYEVRPIYSAASTFGYSDVLNVGYILKDNKVALYIRLKPGVERAIDGKGRRDRFY
jgi:hypothetical protein